VIEPISLTDLGTKRAEELLAWAWNTHGARAAIVTSFQNTGCVMIDMAHRVAPKLRVITIDTLRLHPETYELMEAVETRYGIRVERFTPDPAALSWMVQSAGEYLFFDGREKQEFCCRVRKVEPTERALATVDVWITGLRQDQSAFRKATLKAANAVKSGRTVLKLCPLVDWSEDEVNGYMAANNVPRNALYERGYTSIGCVICSTPTLPGEDKRAGRWRWFNQLHQHDSKECGIHLDGSGI